MRACIRILAVLTILLSTAGLLVSLAGGAGVWVVKGPVTDKATKTFGRVEAKLDVAAQGLEQVKTSLDRAVERLAAAREEQRQLTRTPGKVGMAQRLLARTLQQRLAPEVGNASEKLHTVAEAAVVVNTVLEDLGNFPLLSEAGLDLDGLTELNGRLAEVAPRAWELSRLFGEAAPGPDADTQLSRIDRALKAMRASVAGYELQVAQVRGRTEELKSRTLPWITPAAVAVSLVCFWVALSQLSLLCHAWSWCRDPGRHSPRPG
jgi:hypothetical protein